MALISISFFVFGFAVQNPYSIAQGLSRIIIEPAVLITDYVEIGGIGAAFINAGALMLISIAMLFALKIDIGGLYITSVFLMGSFGLFGKNIFNIWPIIFGAFVYSKLRREPFKDHVHIALLATSISPVVTELLFVVDLLLWQRIVLSLLVGISIGMLIVPLSANVVKLHKGFNLYNTGFSVGILGTVYVSLFKSFGYTVYSRSVWSTGNNQLFSLFLCALFLSMIAAAVLLDRHAPKKVFRIFTYPGTLYSDFIASDGFAASLLNMGINGLAATGYVLLVGGDLNGPTTGGILTVAGFGAFGKHLRNITPIWIGVFIGSLTKIWNINDPAIQLAALFGTSLAPIAGHYGWIWGIAAGYINSSVVLNSGILHGGLNLYNTGFSAGIVATVMVPLLDTFRKKGKSPAQ